jgi:N-acetylglucosamine kinase-like BadF-type ATPase
MVVVLGVDGGNSKTELVAVTSDGALLARVRGPGSNSHAVGARVAAGVIRGLVEGRRADHGVFYLSGADVPADIAELEAELAGVARSITVDNDAFALLRAGTEREDAVAVICGAGINCLGRASGGRVARYPSLGWETGDWGGGEPLGREAIFEAARAEDGRGRPTVLAQTIRSHFGAPSIEAVGADFHYRRLPVNRLGEIAPLVIDAAVEGDEVARRLVERLAEEIALMVRRAFADLGVEEADVVLGGGMLQDRTRPLLVDLVTKRLPLGARPAVLDAPPVAVATDDAKRLVREALAG